MWMWITIAIVLFAALVILLRSDFGKDVTTKTDQQLYRRYLAYMKHSKIALNSDLNKWVEAQNEVSKTSEELQRRGYDLSKLVSEESAAKFEQRPMDFSRARKSV